ncbi:MAG: metallophosphatase family protein [Desulfurococcales archaeon]|nr:metallophosphatase family protein [Desulfurococcales archaeon]
MLVISDVHGNLPALRSIIESAGRYDEVVVLGDLVDYGPWPAEVLDLVRSLGARVVRGNHDHAVGYGVDCRCSEETHWLSVWYRENITMKLLSDTDRQWLARLPLRLALDLGNTRAVAVHAAPSNPLYEYLYPWLGKEEICARLHGPTVSLRRTRNECPGGLYLVGHTHLQFMLTLEGTTVLNPGSAGQPRDGVPKAAYAIIDAETGRVKLSRAPYSVEEVRRRHRELGIPEPYLSALDQILLTGRVPPRPKSV